MNINFNRIQAALLEGPDVAAAALNAELVRVYALPADVHATLAGLAGAGAVHSEHDAQDAHASYVMLGLLRGHLEAPDAPDVTPAPLAALEAQPDRVALACAQLAPVFPGRTRAWHAATRLYFTALWDRQSGPLTHLAAAYRDLAGRADEARWAALHA